MKEGWKYRLFKDVFPIKMGKTPPRGDKSSWDTTKESDNKWVSISDISQNEGKIIFDTKEYITDAAAEKIFRVKANSLLMSFKLTIGKMAFAGTDLYTNEAIIAIPENKEYNLKFLYFYLSSYNWSLLTDGSEKVKGKTLNKESIGRIKLPIISLPEQQRIVSYLDTQFAKIDQLKANAEKQLQAAKDLFQSALKELLTPKDGWEEDKLNLIFNFIDYRGQTPTKIESGVPLITAKNVKYGYIDYTIKDYISQEEYELRKGRGISRKGDLLFTTEAPLGNVAIADLDEYSAGQRIITLQQYDESKYKIDNRFYYYYMLSPVFQNRIKGLATGATAQGIKAKILKSIIVPVPPFDFQQQIANKLDTISAKVKALQTNYTETITLCNDLKQALLKKVFG